MTKTTPPRVDELELSVFGPGIGECLVIHAGYGDWIVVDSCLNGAGDKPVALEYLEDLDVDVSRQVRLVIVTHWHDDHIRGASQLIETAAAARFVCSRALKNEEFLTLVAADEEIKLVEHTSGVSEFAEILEILDRRASGKYRAGPDYWACDGMLLYSGRGEHTVEVHALSPSSQTLTDSKGRIAELIPSPGDAIRRFPVVRPNDSSVVLLVTSPQTHFLLGGDLETGRSARRGWRGVVLSEVRPRVLSSAYKVAHHGSENADLDRIWTDLLQADPVAVLTPYARGSKPLPSAGDIRRIKSRAGELYCTFRPITARVPRRKSVDKTMDEVARSRRAVRMSPGHIRLRSSLNGRAGEFSCELFDGARRL